MVFFWILTVLMILLGLWFVIPPLLSKNSQAELDHDDLNVSIYRQKLADLDKNEENLTAEELAQVRQEIEQGLLQDVGNDEKPATNSISKKMQQQVIIVVAILVPLLALLLYWNLSPKQFTQMVDYQPQTVTKKSASNLPPVHEMVAKLEAKMQQNPEDPKGWQLLGRSYFVMGRYDDAAMSYGRAHSLAGDEPDLLADYAEALAMSLDGQLQGKPQQLIGLALAKQPMHPKSLWLAGSAEFQSGKFENAIRHWQNLLDMHPDKQSEGAKVLTQRIAEVKQRLGGKAAPVQASRPAQKKAAGSGSGSGSTVIQVQVQLDPNSRPRPQPMTPFSSLPVPCKVRLCRWPS